MSSTNQDLGKSFISSDIICTVLSLYRPAGVRMLIPQTVPASLSSCFLALSWQQVLASGQGQRGKRWKASCFMSSSLGGVAAGSSNSWGFVRRSEVQEMTDQAWDRVLLSSCQENPQHTCSQHPNTHTQHCQPYTAPRQTHTIPNTYNSTIPPILHNTTPRTRITPSILHNISTHITSPHYTILNAHHTPNEGAIPTYP